MTRAKDGPIHGEVCSFGQQDSQSFDRVFELQDGAESAAITKHDEQDSNQR
jgi:hypothetical protein